MKIGILGDTQFTNKTPERRKDDYWLTQKRKFSDSLGIFSDYECDIVIQTGDLFDSPTTPNSVVSEIIQILNKHSTQLHLVWGNHDTYGHTRGTLSNSPLAILQASGVIDILDDTPRSIYNCLIYGAGYGDEIPNCTSEAFSILVAHKMIGNRPLYPGDKIERPLPFLSRYTGYSLIILGHYHYRFIESLGGRIIMNPGAMVRESISESDLNHRPSVVIFDTDKVKYDVVELNFTPSSEVLTHP